MSGHSHWSSIKHKKGKEDARRGKIFSKLIKEITLAAKAGGGDPAGNPRLRTAFAAAKQANMPGDNVKKAVMRGTGEMPGVIYEETNYEGYGPGGVAVIVQVTTDNKNRTTSDIRKSFSKHGGNLGEIGCVGWMFKSKGTITLKKSSISEDELLDLALSAGAEDINSDDSEFFEIVSDTSKFEDVKKALEEKKLEQTGRTDAGTDERAGGPRRRQQCFRKFRHRRRTDRPYRGFFLNENTGR